MNKLPQSQAEKGKKEFSLLSPKPELEKLTLYLFVLLLPTQFGKHFWPPFSQILGIRIDYLSPTLFVTDILILALFLFWLKRQNINAFLRALFTGKIGWLIFFVYLAINTVFSNNPLLSFYGFLKILEMTFLGFYIAKNIKTKIELTTLAMVLAFSLVGESLLAIAQYIQQGSINGLMYFLGERKFASLTPGIANASINGQLILRPYGTFPHPNVLAGFLLSATVFIFAFLEDRKNKAIKILKTTALLLGSIALLLTLSRIAIILWIVAIVVILFNLLVKQGKNKSPIIFTSTILIVIISAIGLFLFTPVFSRLEETRPTEKAIIQRTVLIQSSVTIIKTHPLFGVGLYNFLPVLSQVQNPPTQINELQPVHNIFLLTAAETGIIGVIFFIWLLLETYKHLLKYTTSTHKILLTLLSLILILGLFDHYWFTLQQGQLLFALILGLCWIRLRPA